MTKFVEMKLKCEVLEEVYQTVKGDMQLKTGKWDSDSLSYVDPEYEADDEWGQQMLYKREVYKEILKLLEKMC